MNLNSISANVIHAAISVHRELGPGLLESVYQDCMLIELRNLGMKVQGEVPLPVFYKGRKIRDEGFRLDLLVEDQVIVELKSVEVVQPVHKKQLLTYLRLANKELGLLINFGEALLKKGIYRIINSSKSDSANPVGSSDSAPSDERA
jgi:GxxExxY protein